MKILLGLVGILWAFNDEIQYGIALIVVAGILTVISSSLQKQNNDNSSKDTNISGSEYDAAIAKYVDILSRTRALNKLGVDADEVKEVAPIIFGDYEFTGTSELKRGKDKIWRSNIYKAVMFFFRIMRFTVIRLISRRQKNAYSMKLQMCISIRI